MLVHNIIVHKVRQASLADTLSLCVIGFSITNDVKDAIIEDFGWIVRVNRNGFARCRRIMDANGASSVPR